MLPILLLLFSSVVFSQEYSEPFEFYVYSFDEAGTLFQLFDVFDQLESGAIKDRETIDYMLQNGLSSRHVAGLFTEAYFRETQNPDIQKIVLDYVSTQEDAPRFDAIRKRYESKRESITQSGIETYRLNYNEDHYDENIEFHSVQQIGLFDGRLVAFIPMSDWAPLQLKDIKTGEIDDSKISLMSGGGTTAMNIGYRKRELSSLPSPGDFNDPQNLVFELAGDNVISRNNADLTVLRISTDEDSMFSFRLDLYDFAEKTVYEINYFYNISPININYDIFTQLKTHLLYTSFLAYLED